MIAAHSPEELDRRIEAALRVLCQVFKVYRLTINWAKGMTEALLVYRGHTAELHWKARFREGIPSIDTPDGKLLHIVTAYRHVGAVVEATESPTAEARARVDSALAAWYRIAARIFGSPHLSRELKLSLAESLIFSRLFFAVETWAPSNMVPLRALEAVQTRVARRVEECWVRAADGPRQAAGVNGAPTAESRSNEEVRRRLGIISIEAELRRRRLLYLPRLGVNAPDTLLALLQSKPQGRPLPWVQLLTDDLRAVKHFHRGKLEELPDPADDARPWMTLATGHRAAWKDLVREATVQFSSALTATRREPVFAPVVQPADEAGGGGDFAGVPCPDCPQNARRLFASQRAMEAHRATAHGKRREARNFIYADGTCPGCGHCYGTRARAIVHATKTKTCAGIIARAGTCMDAENLAALDCSDAEAAKASRRAGHPTPLARCPGPGRGPKAPKTGSLLAMALALALAAADVDENEMHGDV
ncbi:unnamed protein product [Polarella glacialis]|uniref:Uncharacterized protein n=1 Tax=Polarella glacialis TaxID=89957 RepID=A0A813FTD8_POLGL|nr:unnamed protein product [Polarella glacialis]